MLSRCLISVDVTPPIQPHVTSQNSGFWIPNNYARHTSTNQPDDGLVSFAGELAGRTEETTPAERRDLGGFTGTFKIQLFFAPPHAVIE